ncbi:MAG: hypothetical protein AAFQ52_13925, partial [Chloroflexota bacterium]
DTGVSDTLISHDTMQAPSFALLYTYDTLVVKNERESAVSLRDIRFESDTQTFSAQEWVTRELTAGRCVQVWDILFRHLSEDVAPADTCASRVAYRATINSFWRGDSAFHVWRDDTLLATCASVPPSSAETWRCDVHE